MKFNPRHQPTPDHLVAELLDFLRRKFYQDRAKAFAQDRRRLLDWVVLWPARWLDKRGVTLPADRYREIFFKVFMDGLRFGDTGNVTYLPAWLAKVIQSHFLHHGDEIYAEAKSMRNLVENAMLLTGKIVPSARPDPITSLAEAAAILKPKKTSKKSPNKAQLNLFEAPFQSPSVSSKRVPNRCPNATSSPKVYQGGVRPDYPTQVVGIRAITR